jgi:hypothetical protein
MNQTQPHRLHGSKDDKMKRLPIALMALTLATWILHGTATAQKTPVGKAVDKPKSVEPASKVGKSPVTDIVSKNKEPEFKKKVGDVNSKLPITGVAGKGKAIDPKAKSGDIFSKPKDLDKKIKIDDVFGKGKKTDPKSKDPKGKDPKGKDPKGKDPKDKGGNGGGAVAVGGNGGNASGPGSKGGNGGDAIAINGDNNTVINGNVTVINKTIVRPSFGSFFFGLASQGGFGYAAPGYGGSGYYPGNAGVAYGANGYSGGVEGTDGSPAVAVGPNGASGAEEVNAEKSLLLTRRMLKIKNDTGAQLKVFVQYRALTDKTWTWLPANPDESAKALTYELGDGQELYVKDAETKIAASRVRIWAEAGDGKWYQFRDEDLWLVPEMNDRGEHVYQATEMKTFTFIFPKLEK